jgi:hypothetical protein
MWMTESVERLDARDLRALEAEHVRQAQAERADHADMHEVAATQGGEDVGVISFAVAVEFHGLAGVAFETVGRPAGCE